MATPVSTVDLPDPSTLLAPHAFFHYTTSPPPSLRVLNNSTWTYCGPLLPSTFASLPPSFEAWSNATFDTPSALLPSFLPFLAYVNDFLKKTGLGNYWITVRASLPTDEYNIPRWHTDDMFFKTPVPSTISAKPMKHRRCLSKLCAPLVSARNATINSSTTLPGPATGTWKLCTTLLGPSTLFLSSKINDHALHVQLTAKSAASSENPHSCSRIRCLGCATAADAVRNALATSFLDMNSEVVSSAPGECCWFRLGVVEGAVHSEPPCGAGVAGAGRVFVNVVPGTEEQLRGLMEQWGMGFPRAWSVGSVGGLCVGKIDENGLSELGQ